MILIAGATSQPGRRLIPMLVAKGYQVRALTRDACKLEFARSLGVEVFEGDIRQSDTLLRACEGAEAVVSAVTAIGENLLHEVDEIGQYALMDMAHQCGVKQFVLVSAYGAAADHPVDFFRMKYRVETHLSALNMECTVLRPTAFMEWWCARVGSQVLNDEPATIYGNGKNPINFISAEDVAKCIVLALEDPRLKDKTLTIGGPQNLTWGEVVAVYERLAGKQAQLRRLPAWWLNFLSRVYAPFNETRSRAMAFRYELATSNWQVDMSELVRQYPIRLMSLEDIVRCELAGKSGLR